MVISPKSRVKEEGIEGFKLDVKDKKIISMLSEDGRMPLSAIAKRVRLSRDAIDYRIKRLIKNGIILGFVPKIDLRCFGYDTYHVFMILNILNEERKRKLIETLVKHPNTISVIEYHDTWDLEWVLVAKNIKEFDIIVIDITKEYGDIITRKDELTIIKGYKTIQLPGTINTDVAYIKSKNVGKCKKMKMDKIDLKILEALSENSRISTYDISKKLKISPDTISYRIKKLTNSNIIYGFMALFNLRALGYRWYTFCINVKTFDLNDEMKFKEFISNCPYIIRAVKVFGDWDLLVYITADSSKSFHTTFKQIQDNLSEIILDYQTWIAFKEHTYNSVPKVLINGLT
ncbi:Lrp/AsnC family transcriptional regulator [Candidatus Pacearchaeota archaeon]|nr:Lrp/AsnC family transcriptional regulator [Candidatus Pacearchaeota archaeon]